MRIEVSYSIEDGLSISVIQPYKDVDKSILAYFWNELLSMPSIIERLKKRGIDNDEDLLKEYLICRYGGTDQVTDIKDENTTSDYCHCGNRGNCPDEHVSGLCSSPTIGDIVLSRSEVENLNFAVNDKSVKEIAGLRHKSSHTVEAQVRTVRTKLSARSLASVLAKTTALGITNPYAICR